MRGAFASCSFSVRFLVAASVAVALMAAALVLDGPRTASAEHPGECEVIDLGELSGDAALVAEGRWTTEDCDSAFLPDSDAYTYRFEVTETAWVHIDLESDEGDSFIHLMTGEGGRVAHDDDGGPGLDSRIEVELEAGAYLVEAATGGGRLRGPADFTLTIFISAACEPVALGVLEPGVTLTAENVWAHDDCGARFREDSPAQTFGFELAEEGLVRVDLVSEDGDPYLFLLDADGGYIYSNDDGGRDFNSRIENELPAGSYLVEATTYFDRDSVLTLSPFTVTITLVGESRFNLKVEAVEVPDTVIAGVPFDVHYRVGNLGALDLPADGSGAIVYAVGSGRAFDRSPTIAASGQRWGAGSSYHSGPGTAGAVSTSIGELTPLSLTLSRPGESWVFVAILVVTDDDEENGYHRVWRNLTVLSGPTFDVVRVRVDRDDYWVATETDEDSVVSVIAVPAASPAHEVEGPPRGKVIYTAGTRALTLDGIFERPAIAALSAELLAREGLEPEPVSIQSPSSTTLLEGFAWHYSGMLADSGLAASVAAGNVTPPAAVEDLVLSSANGVLAHFAPMHASWSAIVEGLAGGGTLSFDRALAVQSELAFAEVRVSPLVTAGQAVRAARVSDAGWADPAVQAIVGGLAAQARCDGAPTLGDALEAIGAEDIGATLALDARLRETLPVHGLATDATLCAIAGIDDSNAAFLRSLGISQSEVAGIIAPEPPAVPEPEPQPLTVRILARLAEDGRIEHAAEVGGELVLPQRRFFDASAGDGRWYYTGDVEAGGSTIGVIRARRLGDGRVELGFEDAEGSVVTPDIRYLPAELPLGVWLPSSEFEVPRPAPEEATGG